ncbi:hypothetical protein ACQJBY_003713 [Aegilops geniculata]
MCFRCGDKYSKEHQCKKPMQLLTIQLGEFGEVLTEDAVQALELLSEPETLECCQISAHAISKADNTETIHIRALVGNQVMLVLVDSGSSHSFVDENFAKGVALDLVAVPSVKVTVANGQAMESKFEAPNLTWWAQGHTFETPIHMLQLGAYDAVLGMDWLKSHSPKTCNWEGKSLQFAHGHTIISLQGVQPVSTMQLQAMSIEQLDKALHGNDIWAMAVVDPSSCDVVSMPGSYPEDLTIVLTEF